MGAHTFEVNKEEQAFKVYSVEFDCTTALFDAAMTSDFKKNKSMEVTADHEFFNIFSLNWNLSIHLSSKPVTSFNNCITRSCE